MLSPLTRLLMLEFVTWFIWLGLFALVQRRLCRRFPGIRSVCRYAFLATMLVALVPGIWIVIRLPHNTPHFFQLLNRSFGIGVYAQTALRALIQLRWLALSPLRLEGFGMHSAPAFASERQLLAVLATLPAILKTSRETRDGELGSDG